MNYVVVQVGEVLDSSKNTILHKTTSLGEAERFAELKRKSLNGLDVMGHVPSYLVVRDYNKDKLEVEHARVVDNFKHFKMIITEDKPFNVLLRNIQSLQEFNL